MITAIRNRPLQVSPHHHYLQGMLPNRPSPSSFPSQLHLLHHFHHYSSSCVSFSFCCHPMIPFLYVSCVCVSCAASLPTERLYHDTTLLISTMHTVVLSMCTWYSKLQNACVAGPLEKCGHSKVNIEKMFSTF